MKSILLNCILLLIITHSGFSQTFDKDKLNAYLDALEKNERFMGSVAVSQNGKVVFTRSTGFADIENKVKADENSRYRIGSISKTFTASLVMKAIELNKLSLNQTLNKYFPSIKNSEKITIYHLLAHRSGIHNFTDDAAYETYHTVAKSEPEILDLIIKGGVDFEPDSQMKYSNSNYVLLTFILEKNFKKTYSQILTEYITRPLALTSTYVGGKIDLNKKETNSYTFAGDWIKAPLTDSSIPLGAGSIVSTPTDLVKFSDALFAGKVVNGKSLEQMKALKDNFGLGLIQIPFYDKKGLGHTGGINGFSSVFIHFPSESISYALTSNGTRFNNNDISIAVLSALFGKPLSIPDFKKALELSSEELDKYLGIYSSPVMPLKITITKMDKTLMGQATGQAAFPLEASEKDKFKFDQAGVVLEFNPTEKTMVLKQGGGHYKFTKE